MPPQEDVSDLRDVVDAINKLCETMKTSYDGYEDLDVEPTDTSDVPPFGSDSMSFLEPSVPAERASKVTTVFEQLDTFEQNPISASDSKPLSVSDCKPLELTDPDRLTLPVATPMTVSNSERLVASNQKMIIVSDSEFLTASDCKTTGVSELEPPVISERPTASVMQVLNSNYTKASNVELSSEQTTDFDSESTLLSESDQTEPITVEQAYCDPMSEMYYTASSEVSLLSDIDFPDRHQSEDSDREKDDRNSVMAGHVAAMRERFESMTRTNTPCPDLIRSVSPSFEVFRNFSTSPDHLDKS